MAARQSGKENVISRFFRENKSLVVMLPLLAVLIVVLIIVYSGSGSEQEVTSDVATPSQSADTDVNDRTQVEILPKTERAAEIDEDNSTAVQDPFASPMKLRGLIIYSDRDKSKAIIEYGGCSYIAKKDEAIGDSDWTVADIYEKSLMLSSGEKSQLLTLDSDSGGSKTTAEYVTGDTSTVTVRVSDADIRDVISAIVMDLGYNVVYTGNTVIVDHFEVTDIAPEDALFLLLKYVNLDYLQDGNTMIVGEKETLTASFFDSMVLTRFTLKYIDAGTVSDQISNLGIDVHKVTLDTNPKAIWVQGTPRELGKVRELISMLDRSENAGSPDTRKLTPIYLSYITGEQMNDVLEEIGLPTGIFLDTNSKILYVYVTDSQFEQIEELKSKLDTAENQKLDFTVYMKKLTYVKASEIVPIIYQFGLDVDVITFDRTAMAVWLKGSEEAVKQVSQLIDLIDIKQNIDSNRFFIKRLKNISALEAEYRLSLLDIPEIKTYTFSYPQFSKNILVVCPEDYKIFVMDHLNQFDVASDKIRVPIDYSDDPSGTYRLERRRDLLVSLTGIPEECFTISNNVSRDNNPHYVLILEETPEKIKMVEDMIAKIDDPLKNEYEPGY